ncbi:hypothetical protein SUGI_0937230 [Cryptomeria japonica]|nr:hypothetical protein SUGI_0937230 [Cryptomeria japonica]
MDCFVSQEKVIRGSKLGLDWDHNLKTDILPENEILALMECNVESFDAFDEEEDLKGLVGKEELITRVMKSLEMEIAASPKFLHLEEAAEAMNSCCLQSDSAISMGTCSSSFSDPCQLNLGTECRCNHGEDENGDPQLGFMLSNEMFHELFETSEFYGSEIEGMDILQSLSRTESFSSMKELMDLDMVGFGE